MSVEDEKKWKEVWNLYDLDKDGKVDKSDFVAAVRVCGHRYTAEQMADKMKNYGDQVSYDTFYGFLCDPYTGPTAADLRNALRAFDGKDCGELSAAQIQSLLTTMGDKLSAAEAQPLLDSLPHTGGRVNIEQLVEFLTPPIPSANPDVPALMKELMKEEAAKAGLALYQPSATTEQKTAPPEAVAGLVTADEVVAEPIIESAGASSDDE